MNTLTPANDFVLVRPDETSNETEGGIFLPDAAKKRPETGRVVAIGPKVKESISVGDRIVYDLYAGVDVESDGVAFLLMPIKEVYAVLG